jgi:hypothetical protein
LDPPSSLYSRGRDLYMYRHMHPINTLHLSTTLLRLFAVSRPTGTREAVGI